MKVKKFKITFHCYWAIHIKAYKKHILENERYYEYKKKKNVFNLSVIWSIFMTKLYREKNVIFNILNITSRFEIEPFEPRKKFLHVWKRRRSFFLIKWHGVHSRIVCCLCVIPVFIWLFHKHVFESFWRF